MDQKSDRLYPSAPLENKIDDLERRIEKRLSDVISFNISINNNKGMITYLKDKNNKPKKKYRKYKTLTTTFKSFDTVVITATTSSSFTLSITRIGLRAIPISIATVCGLSFGNKVIYEIIINKYNKYQKQYGKDQQTAKSFDKLYKKSFEGNVIDKTEYENFCNNFNKHVGEPKNESPL